MAHAANCALLPPAAGSALRRGLLLVAAALGLQGLACAGEDPASWVARMNQVLASRNYDGVFVHQLGNHRETLRIIHRIQDGHLSERVVSTDGSGREFVRDGNDLIGYFPDHRIVVVEKRGQSLGFIGGLPGFDPAAQANYIVRDLQSTRFQGRATRVISVVPRDAYRYGYRLWIDERTSMPVRTQLESIDGEIIEQITFASLTMPAHIDDELLKPEVDTEGFKWLRREAPTFRPGELVAFSAPNLPPGFRLSVGGVSGMPGPPRPSSHMVFTDGLASVSVFIESAGMPPQLSHTGTPRKEQGAVQLGAAAAYTALSDGFRVTAIGEVPPETVRAIAEGLRPVGEANASLAGADGRLSDTGQGPNDLTSGDRTLPEAARAVRGLTPASLPRLDRNAPQSP